MKFTAALYASLATFAAGNPLPLDLDVKDTLVARADIVSVTCPMVAGNGNGAVTYSVANIDEAFTIGSGLLRPPPQTVTDNRGMC